LSPDDLLTEISPSSGNSL